MAEKPKFMVLEFCFYLKYKSNKDDIWQQETLPGVLLEERKFLKIKKKIKNKEIHNGCAKMQYNTVAGCIKRFLIIRKPKTKEIKFIKTVTSLGLYILKKCKNRGSSELLFFASDLKVLLPGEFSVKSLKADSRLGWHNNFFNVLELFSP